MLGLGLVRMLAGALGESEALLRLFSVALLLEEPLRRSTWLVAYTEGGSFMSGSSSRARSLSSRSIPFCQGEGVVAVSYTHLRAHET